MPAGEVLPELYVAEQHMHLIHVDGDASLRSGQSQVLRLGEPYWSMELNTTWLDRTDFQTWEGLLVDRRGMASTFLAHRHDRPNAQIPVSSDTGLTVSAISRENSTVSFGNTGTWTATRGDMLSFYTAKNGYWLGMAMETKAASSGAMSALKVHPPPFSPHASLANPRRIRALGEFRLRPPQPGYRVFSRFDERRISFAAMQVIRG